VTRRRTTTAASLVLVGVAGLLLTGCGSADNAGAASVVGPDRVTDKQIGDTTSEIQTELVAAQSPYNAATATTATVDRMTRSLILNQAAVQNNITITPSQVDNLLTTAAASQGGVAALDKALLTKANVPSSAVNSYANDFLIQSALLAKMGGNTAAGTAALTKYLGTLSAQLGTTVAARYGTWNTTTVSLGPVPNNLSSPLPSSSAASDASPSTAP
jgi:hypothetical protein